jgi:hypothetical protein
LQAGANHSQQLLVIGWLLKEGDRTRCESAFFIALGIARGQHDHRNDRKRRILLQVFEHGESVARRQPQIEDDQMWLLFLSHGDGGITVANIHGVEVIGPKPQAQGLPEVRIVIHHHNLGSIQGLPLAVTFSAHADGSPLQ